MIRLLYSISELSSRAVHWNHPFLVLEQTPWQNDPQNFYLFRQRLTFSCPTACSNVLRALPQHQHAYKRLMYCNTAPVEALGLEEDYWVRCCYRSPEKAVCICGAAGHHHIDAWHMAEECLWTLGVVVAPVAYCACIHPHCIRSRPYMKKQAVVLTDRPQVSIRAKAACCCLHNFQGAARYTGIIEG